MIKVQVVKDSISPTGHRLTTMLLTYPRMVHAEFMTHRVFSRNAASSRAIPSSRIIKEVVDNPALPVWWGKNQSGMQAREELALDTRALAQKAWLELRDVAVDFVRNRFQPLQLHKQIANRVLEPWFHITTLVSATEWQNFFGLRCHPDAQPEIQALADLMLLRYVTSTPQLVNYSEWHLPFSGQAMDPAWDTMTRVKVCVARCARTSYLNFEGVIDVAKDLALHDQLAASGHWSPFEHVARPIPGAGYNWSGNFHGWHQYRHDFPNENREVNLAVLLAQRQAAGSKWAKGEIENE